jgi:hypothetical protein
VPSCELTRLHRSLLHGLCIGTRWKDRAGFKPNDFLWNHPDVIPGGHPRIGVYPAYLREAARLSGPPLSPRRGLGPAPNGVDSLEICFARRGKSDRTAALQLALDQARQTYEQTWGVRSKTTVNLRASSPRENGGLQAVDYFLWALQRLYEKGEDRFWEVVRPQAKLVYDMDDTRTAAHGVYYTASSPLILAARAKK